VAFRVLQESGTADQYREIIGDHKRILLALKKRDPMLGRQALLTHFDRAAETMKMAITGNSREKSLHLQKALDGS
jgi:DNA-binding FadR family transcriptional regulator